MISLVRDFTASPGARFVSQGRHSGEELRSKVLLPALQRGDVILDLNGALGLPPSFLDEAIGVTLENEPELVPRLKIILTDNQTARSIFMESLVRRLGKANALGLFADASKPVPAKA